MLKNLFIRGRLFLIVGAISILFAIIPPMPRPVIFATTGSQVKRSADNLQRLVLELNGIVGRFKI